MARAVTKERPQERAPKPPFPAETQESPGIESSMRPKPDYGLDSYQGHERLKDKVALITGGDSGIGRAVALAFAREGADVAFGYLNEDTDAQETETAVQEAGARCLSLKGDIGDPDHCRELVQATVQRFGRIDVLVNNAGFQGKSVKALSDIDDERIEHTLRVNVLGAFVLAREATKYMVPGSAIINVASVQAYYPSPDILDYATTKGALVTFTKGLAQSLLERGIRVNGIAPGPVWTPLIQQSFEAEKVKKFGTNYPMKRPAQPAELAPSFVFLACDDSAYVTGEVLGVTGGKSLP